MALQDILDKAKAKAAKSSGNRNRAVKPAEGKSYWRILPGGWNKEEPEMFYQAHGQHFIKKDGKVKAVVSCPDKTYDCDCELCTMINDAIDALPATATDREKEKFTSMRASQRFLVNAIDRKNDKVVVLELGVGLFNSLIESLGEYDELLDPSEGQDIVINREGKGVDTKYTMTVRPANKSNPVTKSELMEMHDLGEFVRETDESNMQRAIKELGLVVNPAGAASGALTGPKKSSVAFDDDDIDEADILEGAASSGTAADDREIEDAEFEDVEDEPAPKKAAPKKVEEETSTVEGLDEPDDDELAAMLADLEEE